MRKNKKFDISVKFLQKKLHFFIGILIFIFLFGNSGFRKIIRRYWELNKLKSEIEKLKKESNLLKKEIYYLEENPVYIEQVVRRELRLISHGEVEYRFKK